MLELGPISYIVWYSANVRWKETAEFFVCISSACDVMRCLTVNRGFYYIEPCPFICRANQWIGFYMVETAVIKELTLIKFSTFICDALRESLSFVQF